MKNKISPLIIMYAFILAISYLLELVLSLWVRSLYELNDFPAEVSSAPYSQYYGYALSLTLNVIIALILYFDISKLKLHAPYILLATILFRPVGVFAFLIQATLIKINSSELEPIDGVIDR